MTFYSTTDLPPSPPYQNVDEIIISLCDACLRISDMASVSEGDRQQFFDVTISIIDFWEHELKGIPNRGN